jgi:hypothetical protein
MVNYPFYTPFQFASNSPIANIDLDGLEAKLGILNRDGHYVEVGRSDFYMPNPTSSGVDNYPNLLPAFVKNPFAYWTDANTVLDSQIEFQSNAIQRQLRFREASAELSKATQGHDNFLYMASYLVDARDYYEAGLEFYKGNTQSGMLLLAISLLPEAAEQLGRRIKDAKALVKHSNDLQPRGVKYDFIIENGSISTPGRKAEGFVDFVITKQGELRLGRGHHKLASDGKDDLIGAGEVFINSNGKIDLINNNSGHYRPNQSQLFQQSAILKESGLTNPNFLTVDVNK